jgi:hypothetical protein
MVSNGFEKSQVVDARIPFVKVNCWFKTRFFFREIHMLLFSITYAPSLLVISPENQTVSFPTSPMFMVLHGFTIFC